ncbi:hypothetical protein L1987_15778 [Smallanthus sonchifolius]|uniref:Uncharacterized protein n=1 Tax=Smallanthus sonchifolius TaxID=185202 RepID=A0ACB9J710_9ASTR|nr:hypothetical protein L1987_15778 [Smallanthus sonchifolius]
MIDKQTIRLSPGFHKPLLDDENLPIFGFHKPLSARNRQANDSSGFGFHKPIFADENLLIFGSFDSSGDSPFSGKIPAFISNWTNLLLLRLEGNNF